MIKKLDDIMEKLKDSLIWGIVSIIAVVPGGISTIILILNDDDIGLIELEPNTYYLLHMPPILMLIIGIPLYWFAAKFFIYIFIWPGYIFRYFLYFWPLMVLYGANFGGGGLRGIFMEYFYGEIMAAPEFWPISSFLCLAGIAETTFWTFKLFKEEAQKN